MKKRVRKLMFSSKSTEWNTPKNVFDTLNKRFGPFTLDAAATKENTLCEQYYSLKEGRDGLNKKWRGMIFLNPPYGRGVVQQWIAKAVHEVKKENCSQVCCILPARTDTKWWHDLVVRYASHIIFVRGRIKFNKGIEKPESAPFPSVIVVFNHATDEGSAKYEMIKF